MVQIFSSNITSEHIRAIPSKSEAHRALICAALADGCTQIICPETNNDIDATAQCLSALGAIVTRTECGFCVLPLSGNVQEAEIDCGESGSTLRFLLPVISALGISCNIHMRGRLPSRPLSPLYELLAQNGVSLSAQGSEPLRISGKFDAEQLEISGDVSSQFISGLLFAMTLMPHNCELTVTGNIQSEPYIDLTLCMLEKFGACIRREKNRFFSCGRTLSHIDRLTVGGDWSNSAFMLCSGAVSRRSVTVSGICPDSAQGDKRIIDILSKMGADITLQNTGGEYSYTVAPSQLHGISVDASQIPDLVPVIATVAAVADGETVIYNAERLRLKESDRIESTCAMLSALGASIRATDGGMVINGVTRLRGGTVSSFGDHRIAMSAAVASLACVGDVTVQGFEAVNKSYPSFLKHFIPNANDIPQQ